MKRITVSRPLIVNWQGRAWNFTETRRAYDVPDELCECEYLRTAIHSLVDIVEQEAVPPAPATPNAARRTRRTKNARAADA